jgi:hypothetical protein
MVCFTSTTGLKSKVKKNFSKFSNSLGVITFYERNNVKKKFKFERKKNLREHSIKVHKIPMNLIYLFPVIKSIICFINEFTKVVLMNVITWYTHIR